LRSHGLKKKYEPKGGDRIVESMGKSVITPTSLQTGGHEHSARVGVETRFASEAWEGCRADRGPAVDGCCRGKPASAAIAAFVGRAAGTALR
jgi:hypothetical protein